MQELMPLLILGAISTTAQSIRYYQKVKSAHAPSVAILLYFLNHALSATVIAAILFVSMKFIIFLFYGWEAVN